MHACLCLVSSSNLTKLLDCRLNTVCTTFTTTWQPATNFKCPDRRISQMLNELDYSLSWCFTPFTPRHSRDRDITHKKASHIL